MSVQQTLDQQIKSAANSIKQGRVIAYPTEYCFGLGCDLRNQTAVEKILKLKQRDVSKGLIIIGAEIEQLLPWIKATNKQIDVMTASWPASLTWLVDKSDTLPQWISGDSTKVAIRIPNHDVARGIAAESNMAMVSTSCNPSGEEPAKDYLSVRKYFSDSLDYIVDAPVGNASSASTIRDLISGKILR